jgi:hypothetical protein
MWVKVRRSVRHVSPQRYDFETTVESHHASEASGLSTAQRERRGLQPATSGVTERRSSLDTLPVDNGARRIASVLGGLLGFVLAAHRLVDRVPVTGNLCKRASRS